MQKITFYISIVNIYMHFEHDQKNNKGLVGAYMGIIGYNMGKFGKE